jgi:hypothetical protein
MKNPSSAKKARRKPQHHKLRKPDIDEGNLDDVDDIEPMGEPVDTAGLSERDGLYRVQRMRHEHKLSLERGRVLDRSAVERALAEGMAQLFGALDRLFCAEFPALGKGLSERELRALARKQIEELKRNLRESLSTKRMQVEQQRVKGQPA